MSDINASRPAQFSNQTSFALLIADTDGVLTSTAIGREASTPTLNGAEITDGELEGTAGRNITVAMSNTTAGFVAGSYVKVTGTHPTYNRPQVERFPMTANGNATIVGSKMFRPGVPIVVELPAGGAWVHGTVPGPWDFAPADQLDIEIDTVADNAQFDAAAAVVTAGNAENYDLTDGHKLTVNGRTLEFSGRQAAAVVSGPAPFSMSPGDQLLVDIDGTSETVTWDAAAGTVTSGNSEPYNMAPDDDLDFEIEGVPFTATVLAETAAPVVSTNSETFDMSGVPLSLLVNIDGEEQTVTFEVTDFVAAAAATAEEIVTAINADLTGSPASGTTDVTLSSAITGSASRVQVIGGSANAVLGFPTTNSVGSGNVADVDAVTAEELVAIINAVAPGVASGTTDLTLTGTIEGTGGLIEVVAGNIATVVDIAIDTYAGTGDVVNIAAVTQTEAVTRINADCTGSPASAITKSGLPRVKISSLITGADSQVNVTGGDANDAFDFDTDNHVGSGNVGNIDAVTATEAAALLDTLLTGIADVDVNVNKPRITSIQLGYAAVINVSESPTAAFNFAAQTFGTGDVADINAVTPEEFQRVVEADTDAVVVINADRTVSVGHATGTVDQKIQVMSTSEVEAIVGLDTNVHAAGGITVGVGVAVALDPPGRWLYANATGNLYVGDDDSPDNVIQKVVVDAIGPVPVAASSLHASTTITDLGVAIK